MRQAGRSDEARADYERLSRLRPTDPDPWFWLGTIDRWGGRDPEALEGYGRAIDLARCHTDALEGRARVLRRGGRDGEAESDLRAALSCRPGEAEASELLAELLARKGDRPAAEAILKDAFQGADLTARLGDLAFSSQRFREASEHYRSAVAARPAEPSFLRRLGDAERERGNSGPALAAYREALRLDPDDGASLYWVGVLATRSGDRAEAMTAWDRILGREPDEAAALVGKARLLRAEGREQEALALVEQALRSRPDDQDAQLLRASILAGLGRRSEAREEYRSVALRFPSNLDAWRGLDRIGPERSFGIGGRYDSTEVIEGLEDEGLLRENGEVIRAARVEYLTETAAADLRLPITPRSDLAADLSAGREAVRYPEGGNPVYDYDVLSATAGMDHRVAERWKLSWRLGTTAYGSRYTGAGGDPTISDESRFKGAAGVEWSGPRDRITAGLSLDSFIWRGFAQDTQFRIFRRSRLSADWARGLVRGFSVRADAAVSDFDDGNTVGSFGTGLHWESGDRAASLRFRHDPFPARFLTTDTNGLDFVSYDALSLTGRTPLAWRLRLSGEVLVARFGATPRTVLEDRLPDGAPDGIADTLVDGPLERNTQRLLRATLAWSPRSFEPLTLGIEHLYDHYEFDTGDYNNNNTRATDLFVEMAKDVGPRWHYALRYVHGFVADERDPGFDSDALWASLDVRLGSLGRSAGAPRLAAEALVRNNSLEENANRLRVHVTFPF